MPLLSRLGLGGGGGGGGGCGVRVWGFIGSAVWEACFFACRVLGVRGAGSVSVDDTLLG